MAAAQRYDWNDGTAHRTEVKVGSTVRVISYGYGARLIDCGSEGTVTGFGRSRCIVELPEGTRNIGPECLRVI